MMLVQSGCARWCQCNKPPPNVMADNINGFFLAHRSSTTLILKILQCGMQASWAVLVKSIATYGDRWEDTTEGLLSAVGVPTQKWHPSRNNWTARVNQTATFHKIEVERRNRYGCKARVWEVESYCKFLVNTIVNGTLRILNLTKTRGLGNVSAGWYSLCSGNTVRAEKGK